MSIKKIPLREIEKINPLPSNIIDKHMPKFKDNLSLIKAAEKTLWEVNKPIKIDDVLNYVLVNEYFEKKKTIKNNLSFRLKRLVDDESKPIDRVKCEDDNDIYYYINIDFFKEISDDKDETSTIPNKIEKEEIEEKIVSLEEKFEKITGMVFSEFYSNYRPKLVWYLTKYTHDQEISEDFADDAFTQSLLKIDNYDPEKSQIHTWIYKIAENLVKKDFKDQKRMSVVSLDKENTDNLNLINVIPSGYMEEKNVMEEDSILIKKAELVKESIYKLPEKYKRVMILREIEKRPYLDIAEMCVKEYKFEMNDSDTKELFAIEDFLELYVNNYSDEFGYVNVTFNENGFEQTIQLDVKPNKDFQLNRGEIENISNIEIISNSGLFVHYKTTTNLSTIKSQISKGRQLIQSMVSKKFKMLDEQGLPNEILFGEEDKPQNMDIFEGDDAFGDEYFI